jgi:DNA-binding CsgD family transcriptional regulator
MLFAERAAAGSGRFELTAGNQDAVVDLCRRLDGLPLAIELAAVRTRVLTVEQILARLSDRFGLLTAGARAALPRHKTLGTTIDWSHDLLAADEQALLRRLGVFAGRFTLDDVEAVGDVPAARVLDLMSSLVDKSLVVKEDVKDLACYRLHETMREYAGLKLRAAAEADGVEVRFVEYYRARCWRAAIGARFRLVEWLEWLDLEIDNIRSVLRWCAARRDSARGLDLAVALGMFWVIRGTSEGIRWFDVMLGPVSKGPASAKTAPASPFTYALAQFLRGFLAVLQSDPGAARPGLDRAATAAEELGFASLQSQSLSMGAVAANLAGDRPAAQRLLEAADDLAAAGDDYMATVAVLQARALDGMFHGDHEAVRAASVEGIRHSRRVGDLYGLEMMLANLGSAAILAGELDDAKRLFSEALRIARRIDDQVAQYVLLNALGCHAAACGQPKLAAQLLGAAEIVQIGIGASVMPYLAPLLAAAEESARTVLGSATFEAEFAAGRRLRRAAAVGLALGEPEAPLPAEPDAASPLRKREAEVARLVADGLSNKQIGARLLISEHTVDSHVRSILNKLGVSSRAQIAAWIATQT